MNNVWAIVLPDIATGEKGDVEMVYFGRSREQFRSRMQRDIRECIRRGYEFDDAWTKIRMLWRPNESVNDLMTGLLLALYDAYEGPTFVNAFFAELRNAKCVNEGNSGSDEFQLCRDNVYRIASRAAQRDLKHCFIQQLGGWGISSDVLDEIDALYAHNK